MNKVKRLCKSKRIKNIMRHMTALAIVAMIAVTASASLVFAADDPTAQVVSFLQWGLGIMGGVALILGIAFTGIGWWQDDTSSKTRGYWALAGALFFFAGSMFVDDLITSFNP